MSATLRTAATSAKQVSGSSKRSYNPYDSREVQNGKHKSYLWSQAPVRAALCCAAPSPGSAPSSPLDDVDQLAVAASILAAQDSPSDRLSPAVIDSLEEESRSLLLDGAPQALDADALAAAVGILRQRLEDDSPACALSSKFADLLQLLDSRPPSAAAADGAGGGDRDLDSPLHAPQQFWSGPDEWSDVRAALMSIGVDTTMDEEDGGGGGGFTSGAAVRLDPETANKLAEFLSELQQRRPQQEDGAQRSAGARQHATAAAAVMSGGSSMEESDGEGEDAPWWAAVTTAYGRLWEEAKAQQQQQQQEQ